MPKNVSWGQRARSIPSSVSAMAAGIMEQSAPVSTRKSKGREPRRVRRASGTTGSATRPKEMTLVPMGKSTGINADGVFRRDVADDQMLARQVALANGLKELPVGQAAGE